MARWAASLTFLVVVAGCGGGGRPGQVQDQGQEQGQDQGLEQVGDASGEAEQVDAPDFPPPEVDVVEGPVEAGEPGDITTDEGEEEGMPGCPGGTGCACAGNGDCLSGFCVETMKGAECSQPCSSAESCPKGWKCSQVLSGTDVVYVCTAPYRLCQPCKTDTDCESGGTAANICIEGGPQGWFCGVECSADSPCPEGYDCSDVQGAKATVKQCRPAAGAECECTEKFKKKGFQTVCTSSNEFGTCSGLRACDEPCPAPAPAVETCDGTDNDCDGKTDEDAEAKPCDLTNAYGTCKGQTLCVGGKELCQGTYASAEACNKIDDDCDGETDEADALGCKTFYKDGDDDSWGNDAMSLCLCGTAAPYDAAKGGDCDDEYAFINPGMKEVCNAVDDDCDGGTDEGFPDVDGNGKADCAEKDTDKDGDPDESDCAPLDPTIYHKAKEGCDGIDQNCDGKTDEGFDDTDGDGKADCVDDDDDGDGVPDGDDNCPLFPNPWQEDMDKDGLGNGCDPDVDGDGVANDLDCEPMDPAIYPGAEEVCDGKDNDCDGETDEAGAGCVDYFKDSDGDGYGITSDTKCLCGPEAPYTASDAGDCDDADKAVNPAAQEACNAKDDDCDGLTDEVCKAASVVEEFATASFDGMSGPYRLKAGVGVPDPVGVLPGGAGAPWLCGGAMCVMELE